MKTVIFFVFLAFALVLSHQDVQKRGGGRSGRGGSSSRGGRGGSSSRGGNGGSSSRGGRGGSSSSGGRGGSSTPAKLTTNALTNLVSAGVPVNMDYLYVTSSCRNDMMARRRAVGNTGILYDFRTPCYLIGQRDLTMNLRSRSEKPVGPTALIQDFQAVFLYFEENRNTYMILDPSVVRWFFTSRLSGCDVFVARPKSTAPVSGNRPIVIHSNMNQCVNNVQNLKLKGNSVDELMNSYHPNYKLIARVFCAPLPGDRVAANQYLAQYERNHPGIKLISYKMDPPAIPQLFYFVGYYQPEKWTFILKGADDGKVTRVCSVPKPRK